MSESGDPIKQKTEARKQKILDRVRKKLNASEGDVKFVENGTLQMKAGLSVNKMVRVLGLDDENDPAAKKALEEFQDLNSADPMRQARALCKDPNTPQWAKDMAIWLALNNIPPTPFLIKKMTIVSPVSPPTDKLCQVCNDLTNMRCAGCKDSPTPVYFCSKACQKAGWKAHKPHCVPRSKSA